MQLLVSVTDADDARAAVRGGADVIDAKDPSLGALGPVTPEIFSQISAAVDGSRPVSAALGDTGSDTTGAVRFAAAGAAFVKIGFADLAEADHVRARLAEVVHAIRSTNPQTRVVAVAYADFERIPSPGLGTILEASHASGAAGFLIDTADKSGPGLMEIMDESTLGSWIDAAHARGLLAAVAGKLAGSDLPAVARLGADIAGVRGAACTGGRTGHVTVGRVRALRELSVPASAFRSD